MTKKKRKLAKIKTMNIEMNEMIKPIKSLWSRFSLTSKSIRLDPRANLKDRRPISKRSIKWRSLPWKYSISCGYIAWKIIIIQLSPTTHKGEKVKKLAKSSLTDKTVECWVPRSTKLQSKISVRFSITTFLWAAFSSWISVFKTWNKTNQSFPHKSFWGSLLKEQPSPSYHLPIRIKIISRSANRI